VALMRSPMLLRNGLLCGEDQKSLVHVQNDANDAVDGAHSAASKCHRVVALEQTTLRGAVHGRG
jgi:hypothetical protein